MKNTALIFFILFIILVGCSADSFLLYQPEKVDEYYYKNYVFTVESDGNTIYGVYIPAPSGSIYSNITVIFSHGNGGSMNSYIDAASLFNDIGVNFVMYDYRGYGKSEGTPSEQGLYRDSEAIVDYVKSISNIDPNNIFYVGYSLGAAVSIETSLRKKPRGLIIIAGFTSMDDMADYYSTYSIPGNWVLEGKFDNYSKIDKVGVPLILFHGDKDTTVPLWMGKNNYSKAKEPKKMIVVNGANHYDIFLYKSFYSEVLNFITSYSD